MGDRPQRVRPAPASNERQIRIDERVTKRETDLPTRSRSSDQTRKLVHPHMLQPPAEGPGDAAWIIRVLGGRGHSIDASPSIDFGRTLALLAVKSSGL